MRVAARPLLLLAVFGGAMLAGACSRAGRARGHATATRIEVWDWSRWNRARRVADSTREAVGDTAIYRIIDSIAGAASGRSAEAYRAWQDSTQAAFDTLGRVMVTAMAAMLRDSALARHDTANVRRIDSLLAEEARDVRPREPRWRSLRDSSIRWMGLGEGSCGFGISGAREDVASADSAMSVRLRLVCARRRAAGAQTFRFDVPLAHGWTVRATRVAADSLTGAAADSAVAVLHAPQPGDRVIRMEVRLRASAGATTSARVTIEVQGPWGTDPYPRYERSRRTAR